MQCRVVSGCWSWGVSMAVAGQHEGADLKPPLLRLSNGDNGNSPRGLGWDAAVGMDYWHVSYARPAQVRTQIERVLAALGRRLIGTTGRVCCCHSSGSSTNYVAVI